MKIYSTFMGITGAAIASVFLGACSGGGISVGAGTTAGIDGSAVVSRGTITGFGSVIVNGVHYDTSKATIKFDDNPGVESDLRIGQVVTIQGTISDDNPTRGTADQIVSKSAVEGPISAIDTAAGTATVLGQVVHVGADTSFGAGLTLASLAVNDVIEVSGFARADGSIDATRIERSSSTTTGEFEVKGIVQNLDTVAQTFAIGALSINYSTAAIDPELGNLQNGLSVEVKGTLDAGVMQATSIEPEDDIASLVSSAGTRLEIEGIMSNYNATARSFQMGTTQVVFTTTTRFEDGTQANLADNIKVEVEGVLNSNGVFQADKIEIEPNPSIEIEADVQAIDANAGTLAVLGITVHVDPLTTRLEDKSSGADNSPSTPFSLASLRVGDRVEIRASLDASGKAVATRLERDDPDSRVTLQGSVDSVAQPNLTILGVTVATTSGATQFRNIDGTAMTQGDFLSQAQGKLVKAEGTLNGGTIVATQVEFEND
ncbi:MAG: hypothetical protein EPN72_03075 [Nevskiaceae bacterium]|nr:MAG: hypothetical protein EPN63_13450 [Nevskiaceae bacterium]TBR74290.1 MAG: hypothetical protein EPN72_03075 [Nevskiaceae bacterium]